MGGRSFSMEGGRLLDACDELGAPIEFSCRSADCGTCIVEVIEGDHLVEPPSITEREGLQKLCAKEPLRLACQAVIKQGAGIVRLRTLASPRPR